LLTGLAPTGVIEWMGREDPMVKRLLALRPDVFQDFTQGTFESLLQSRARVTAREALPGARVLYRFDGR